jgi:hypothetical protein
VQDDDYEEEEEDVEEDAEEEDHNDGKFVCETPGCYRSYANINGLNYHGKTIATPSTCCVLRAHLIRSKQT